MLRERRHPEKLWECGGIELRADGLSFDEVLPAVRAFADEKKRRGFAGPVVFTLRLRRDGGDWEDARAAQREPLWVELAGEPAPLCDLVDVEIEEIASLDEETRQALFEGNGKTLLSHHAFVPESVSIWERHLAAMSTVHPAAVKFAVTPENSGETTSLLRFARDVAEKFSLSCVIGMGEAGQATRVVSPLLGCPITYAFLEDGPVAPGQLSLEVLQACFARTGDRPAQDAAEGDWIHWAETAIREAGFDR